MYSTVSGSNLSAMRKNKPGKEDWGGGGREVGWYVRVKREDAEKEWLFNVTENLSKLIWPEE